MRQRLIQLCLINPIHVRNNDWIRRWNLMAVDPIQNWATRETKLIRISEGLSTKSIELRVREVDVATPAGEGLGRNWGYMDTANEFSTTLTTLALVDLKATEAAYANYFPEVIGYALKRFSGPSDGLISKTYRLTCQVFKDPTTPRETVELLKLALNLWTAVRLSTMPNFIVGEGALRASPNAFAGSPPCDGMVPAPRLLNAQLQLTLIHYIQETLRTNLMLGLQRRMHESKKRTWLVMYIVTFILLHNTTLLTAHEDNTVCRGRTNVSLLTISWSLDTSSRSVVS